MAAAENRPDEGEGSPSAEEKQEQESLPARGDPLLIGSGRATCAGHIVAAPLLPDEQKFARRTDLGRAQVSLMKC